MRMSAGRLALFTSGFALFLMVASLLGALGVPVRVTDWLTLLFVVAGFVCVGLAGATMDADEFLVGDRHLTIGLNASAIAAGAFSGVLFLCLAGVLSAQPWQGAALVAGIPVGLLLSAILIVPCLRGSDSPTLADFLAMRFASGWVRLVAGVIAAVACLMLLSAEFAAVATIAAGFMGIDPTIARYAFLVLLLIGTLPGGARGVAPAQIALLVVSAAAYLLPSAWLSSAVNGHPFPQASLFDVLANASDPVGLGSFAVLFLCITLGAACFPHFLARAIAARSPADARSAHLWGAVVLAPVLAAACAFALFAVRPDRNPTSIAELMIGIPQLADVPFLAGGLIGAGGLAAALAAGTGLALAAASALSHDSLYRIAGPHAPVSRRVLLSRLMLVGVIGLAAAAAPVIQADMWLAMLAAFSLAAAGLFPVILLGIWWPRTSAPGAIAGMVAGFAVAAYYMAATHYAPVEFYELWSSLSSAGAEAIDRLAALKEDASAGEALVSHARSMANWWGVETGAAAIFGIPAGLISTVAVSLLTRAPAAERRSFLIRIHAAARGEASD